MGVFPWLDDGAPHNQHVVIANIQMSSIVDAVNERERAGAVAFQRVAPEVCGLCIMYYVQILWCWGR